MTDRFERIEKAFEDFRSKVEHCRDPAKSDMADIQDAYDRLNRLRNRFKYEAHIAHSLDSAEMDALQKVFEKNAFIEGMCKNSVIGRHVMGDPLLYDINYVPFELAVGVSGATVFVKRRVSVPDTKGESHDIDHLKSLSQAVECIGRAIAKAKDAKAKGA
jgi:hypothetical protein